MSKLPDKKRLEAFRAKISEDIADVGWSVVAVADTPSFAYTVGLTETLGHPELVMVGFDPRLMHRLLNDCARHVKAGQEHGRKESLADGERIEGIIKGLPLLARRVDRNVADRWALAAASRYGSRLELVQILLPDVNGLFPGEAGCDPQYILMQDPPPKGAAS